jgi:adenine-specific DNA-methyltransferase
MRGALTRITIYWVTSERWDLRVLGAILMSEVGEFFVRCYSVRMRGGALRFQAQNLRRIRVPVLDTLSEKIKKQLAAAFDDYDVAGANILTKKIYGIDRIP